MGQLGKKIALKLLIVRAIRGDTCNNSEAFCKGLTLTGTEEPLQEQTCTNGFSFFSSVIPTGILKSSPRASGQTANSPETQGGSSAPIHWLRVALNTLYARCGFHNCNSEGKQEETTSLFPLGISLLIKKRGKSGENLNSGSRGFGQSLSWSKTGLLRKAGSWSGESRGYWKSFFLCTLHFLSHGIAVYLHLALHCGGMPSEPPNDWRAASLPSTPLESHQYLMGFGAMGKEASGSGAAGCQQSS